MGWDGKLDTARPTCMFCGGEEALGIGDIWTDHAFTLDACCEGLLERVSADMQHDPGWARGLLRQLGAEELTGQRLRRVCDGEGGVPLLDYKLQVRPVTFAVACAFVRRHHAHCGPPVAWRTGIAAWNGAHTMLGVAMVGNPVARAFNGRGTVEVNRLCVRRDLAPMLARDACSTLYAAAGRWAEAAGFARIITYTHADEGGASLRAVGWVPEASVRGRGWHSARRPRSNANALVDKTRWAHTLRPRAPPHGGAGTPPRVVLTMEAAVTGTCYPGLTLER